MTVRELIEELQSLPHQDLHIVVVVDDREAALDYVEERQSTFRRFEPNNYSYVAVIGD